MKKRIIFSSLVGAVVFLIAFAVLCPSVTLQYLKPEGSSFFQYDNVFESDAVQQTDSGKVAQYKVPTESVARGVEAELTCAVDTYTKIKVEFATDETFSDLQTTEICFYKDDIEACAEIGAKYVRIYFDENTPIQKVLFYENAPLTATRPFKIGVGRYFAVAVFSAIAFAVMFFADMKFNLLEKSIACFKKKRTRIITLIIMLVSALMVSALAEIVLRMFIGPDSIGRNFNLASFGTFAIVFVTIVIFVFERKNFATKPERAVAMIVLAVGCLIIFTEPFSHNSSDEDSHYYWAVQNSFYDEAYLSESDYNVRYTIGFSLADSHAIGPSLQKVVTMNENDAVVTYARQSSSSLPHKAAGILIAVARLFGASFWEKFVIGQFGMLLVYAATVYFAIKKLKSGKMILSVIALLPTNIVLASNYSYDPWVTGFSMLGMAYFVSEIQQPEKEITVWETVVMCGAFVLAAIPKQIFVLLMLLPIFMFKRWSSKNEKRRYYLIFAAFFALMFVLFLLRAYSSATGSGDVRGGAVNPSEQIAYIFSNPLEYTKTLLRFLAEYVSPANANKCINFFSYLGDGKSPVIFALALIFCALTDKNETNRFKGHTIITIIVIAIEFALVCLIATALYISFTPVGHGTINGCHQRYLVPLLAPFALLIANPGFVITKNQAVYNGVVLAMVATTLIYKTLMVVTWPML